MREWKELLFAGKPLYEAAQVVPIFENVSPVQLVEMEKLEILNCQDYDEYNVSDSDRSRPCCIIAPAVLFFSEYFTLV